MKTKFYLNLKSWLLMMLMLIGAGGNLWAETYKLTITADDFNSSSYAANNNEKTSQAVSTTDPTKTYEVKWTSNQVMNSNGIQWQKNNGYIYNSTDLGTITGVTITKTSGSFTTYYGTEKQPSQNTTVGGGYFQTKVGNATGRSTRIEVVFRIDEESSSKTDIATLNSISPTSLTVGDKGTFDLDATFADGVVANEDYEISWESDNAEVLTLNGSSYEAKKAGKANVTVHVTVLDEDTYNEVEETFAVTVTKDLEGAGTEEKPYTVADVLYLFEVGLVPTDNVFVKGKVSEIKSLDTSKYTRAQYYISDNGETDNQFYVYNGKYLNGANFTSNNQLEVGDEVVICGKLTTYNNINEFAQDNYIVSNDHGDAVFSFGDETEFEVAQNKSFTAPELSKGKYDGTVVYESSNTNVATVATDGTVTLVGLGETTITASGARTSAYHTPTPASYTLTVVAAVWNVEAQASEGGTVSIDGKVITATPAEDYRFANPAYTVSSGEATVSQEGNIFTVTPASDCTVTINFEKIPEHNVVWSINGEETSTTALEDAAVEFPAAPEAIEGKTFVGWVTEAINDETDEAPAFVTSATMATSDLKYYAVFADAEEGEEVTATLTANSSWSSYVEKTVTDDKGNDWTGLISGQKNSGVYHYGLNSTAYLSSPSFSGNIKEIKIVATNGSSKNRTFTFKDGDTEVGTLLVSKNTTDTELSAVLNGTSFRQFTLTASDALQFTSIAVTYGGATYSGYCTTVIKPVATFNGQKYESLQAALDAAEAAEPAVEDIVIDLLDDATLDITAWSGTKNELSIGTANTKSITINGNSHTLNFNQKNSDWNNVATMNDAETKLVLNNMSITSSGYNDGPWNRHDINFNCAVELNNVTSDKALAFKNSATLNNVTVTDNSGSLYGIWISPRVEGQNVSINGLTVTAERGIKIDDEYDSNPGKVTMDIANATFNTTKKAAILVKNAAATSITAGEGINIENVAADNTNLVWVDEDKATEYYNVTVTGANLTPEGTEAAYAAKIVSGDKPMGYYKTFAAAVEAAESDQVVTLLKDVATYELAVGKTLKVDKNNHNIKVTVPEGYALNEDVEGNVTTYSSFAGIIINNVDELKAFRDAVNGGNQFAGKTVKLAADLDLSGEENWTPIGNLVAYPGQSFDGVFDGNGHTIKNVTVVDQTTPEHAVAGLFGSVVNGTIKNLTVENVNLTSSHYAGGIVAYTSNKPIIENCHVIGGTITSVPELINGSYDNGDKVGGIMGYATAGSTINNCTVDGLTIKAYRDMGGIVGYSAGNVTNNTVKNTTIIQSDVNAYKNEEIKTYDYIVGRNGGATLENNVYEELNNVLTIDGAVAKIGDKLYRKLQAAVDAAEAGQTIDIVDDFTLTTVTTSPSDKYNVNVNKSVTINGNGHVITSAQGKRAIVLKGEGLDVTIKDLTIKNNKAEACLWIASNLTCTLDNTVLDGTNGKSYNQPLTIGSISNEGRVTLNVTNGSVIKTNDAGTAHYAIIASHPADITVTKSKLIGWGNVYLKPDAAGSTVKIEGSEMKSQGLSGSSNNFSILVTEGGNNTIEVKDTKITSSAVEGTYESLITLGGEGNVVKLLGETTYETNDKTWGAITYNWGSLKNNKLYLDDTTKAAFAEYLDGSHQETIEPADETGLYPVSFEPEVLYYWAVEDGYNGGYYSFADPFKNGWLADGEFIALQKNITLTEDITCQLASGTSFNFLLGDFTADKNGHSVALKTGVTVLTDKQTDIFKAAEAGYVIVETETETGYSYTAEKVMLAQPIIFHDGGEYEGELTVAIAGEGVKYTLNGGAEQTYSAPFSISETTTVKAWAEKDGVKSNEVEKTFTIVAKQAGAEVADGYYNIKTNDGKFVNVAGRKTVTLVSDTEGKAGTVIRVKADAEGVKVLRSQGVDLPGYAKKAMNYVPEIVQLAVDKLHAEGAGELLGETGLEKIMDKFNESFDYNLYLEKDGEAYRIYGRTPSMKPVVDFYAENKANVDAKLPELEEFINNAIQKVLQKTNGSGASVLVPFSLQTIWERMGSTLTNPADDEAKFYEEVLSSEANVWNFAYQTAMLYWGNLKNHPRFAEIQNKLGDYSKYIDKVENIRPNFRYYIVPSESGVDFISQGNSMITDASTAWTMEPVSKFMVNFETEQAFNIYPTTSGGETIEAKEYYTTLYTDFAYTLPDDGSVKACKVTKINEKYSVAVREEIEGTIPAQTPVMLVSSNKGAQALTLSTEDGTPVTGNLLVGADALINEYQIKTPQVVSLFDMAKSILGESAYDAYLSKYEHLMLKNAGTVGNKYFFGLTTDDLGKCADDEGLIPVRSLDSKDSEACFCENWQAGANKAFLVTEKFDPVKLFLVGDVNRDGNISIADVTALVNIILGKATYPADNDKYDFAAANVNNDKAITISDVTALVNIILGK